MLYGRQRVNPTLCLFYFLSYRKEIQNGGHYAHSIRVSAQAGFGCGRKAIKKQGIDAAVQLNDLRVNYTDKTKKVGVHLDIDAEMTQEALIDILSKAGVL